MSNRLLVNPGSEQAWEITLRPGVNRIGRGAQCDFPINHPSISTTHCEIIVSDAGVLLKDLGSRNGTFVNRSPVREVWLQPGQHVQFGAIDSTFEADQPVVEAPIVGRAAPGAVIAVAAFGPAAAAAPVSAGPAASGPDTRFASKTTASLPAAPPTPGRPEKFPVHFAAELEARRRKRFLLGVVGAVFGAMLGLGGWYLLIRFTQTTFGFVAWGVGIVAGLGARLPAHPSSRGLGTIAAICALLAIAGGEYLTVRVLVQQAAGRSADEAYVTRINYAHDALKAETPDQIRVFLARASKPATEITDAEVSQFQEEDLPKLRAFTQGQPTRVEFVTQAEAEALQHFNYRQYFLEDDLKSGLFLVIFALIGIVSAYRIGSSGKDISA